MSRRGRSVDDDRVQVDQLLDIVGLADSHHVDFTWQDQPSSTRQIADDVLRP
jgi:hypothetical protein